MYETGCCFRSLTLCFSWIVNIKILCLLDNTLKKGYVSCNPTDPEKWLGKLHGIKTPGKHCVFTMCMPFSVKTRFLNTILHIYE